MNGAQFSQKNKSRWEGWQGYLGEIPVFDVDPGHAVQPRLPELRGAGIGLGQTVLEVHQHLRVILVLLHLGRGHQDRAYPFGQVLHVRGEGGVLKQGWEKDTWFSAVFGLSTYMVERRQSLGGKKDKGTRPPTLMSLSLLAQLLMIDKDCWNLVPPIPTTSAISWLTEIMTLGTHKCEQINSPSNDSSPGLSSCLQVGCA